MLGVYCGKFQGSTIFIWVAKYVQLKRLHDPFSQVQSHFVTMLPYSPMAVLLIALTCTVISVDDGLLRTSTGCAGPSSSLTLYVDWLKVTVMGAEVTLMVG